MAIKSETRKYTFSDAFLKERSDSLVVSLTRDQTALAEFNVTSARITGVGTLKAAFIAVGVDQSYMGPMVTARQDRDNKTTDLYRAVLAVGTKVRENWPTDEGKEIEFLLTGSLSQLDAKELLESAKGTYEALVKYQSSFASTYGVNTAYLAAFMAKITALDVANTTYTTAFALRKAKTTERIRAGNALYAEMLRLAQVGQDYWQFTNRTMYDEYVLNHNVPTPPQDIIVHVDPGQTVPIPFNNIEADSSIFMENQTPTPGADAIIYFATSPTDPIPTEAATLVAGASENHNAGDLNFDTTNINGFMNNPTTFPIDVHFVVNV